ncbi:MAG: ribonuclease III [Flavobacteriaceae bacterium]|nr:ribonuclease III [Flavobacteriaceae bacterium]
MKIVRKLLNIKESKTDFFKQIKAVLGFSPLYIDVYKTAFIHSSTNKKDALGNPLNYERLEFLGDALLSSAIALYLYNKYPYSDEGYLTQMRSKIVNRKTLNEIGLKLDLISLVNTSMSKSKMGTNIHGNILEALIGAIYLDLGNKYCQKFIANQIVKPLIEQGNWEGRIDSYKSVMIEWSQKNRKNLIFETYEDSGNDKTKHFSVKLNIEGKTVTKGRATSKKKAEEMAAKRAYFAIIKKLK